MVIRLRKEFPFEEEYGLDYFISDDKEPKPYDLFYSTTKFGNCEGIYTDFYVVREADQTPVHIATAKTLFDSDEAYIKMHELGAKVSLELSKMTTI